MPRPKAEKTKARTPGRRGRPLSGARLQRLIAEATVDAYDASEQLGGLFTMIEEHLAVPFETEVLGVPLTVVRIDLTEADVIVAICQRAQSIQPIAILDLPLPEPPPAGSEWIDAYRLWARGG